MKRLLWLAPVWGATVACSDYDLNRPVDGSDPVDTGEQVPGDEPDIRVAPSSLDFGWVLKGCDGETLDVTIENIGGADLDVADIAIVGDGSSSFALDWDGASFTLAPGDAVVVPVSFTPQLWADYAVDVEVRSNDPDEARVLVPTVGVGAQGSRVEEGFTQDYTEKVDVLWVVDNSGSMSDEIAMVQDNFQHFIEEWVQLDLDYHLAVVTTDMDQPMFMGRIQGQVITPATPDPVTTFLDTVNLGTGGSGSERGFDATKAALTEPLVSSDNAGFLRADAGLSVIVLSDENEDGAQSPASFVSWFRSLKTSPDLAVFNAIVGDRGLGCNEWIDINTVLSASGGDKYIDAANTTNGFFASICTSNYEVALQNIALSSAGMTVRFPLSDEPAGLSGITVWVDGEEIAQDGMNGWTYDATTNTIVFHGDAIPAPGAEVIIEYPKQETC